MYSVALASTVAYFVLVNPYVGMKGTNLIEFMRWSKTLEIFLNILIPRVLLAHHP